MFKCIPVKIYKVLSVYSVTPCFIKDFYRINYIRRIGDRDATNY